jgi:hypothetical protein
MILYLSSDEILGAWESGARSWSFDEKAAALSVAATARSRSRLASAGGPQKNKSWTRRRGRKPKCSIIRPPEYMSRRLRVDTDERNQDRRALSIARGAAAATTTPGKKKSRVLIQEPRRLF